MTTTQKQGGARKGAFKWEKTMQKRGRPPIQDSSRKKTTTIRLSEKERLRFELLGGVKWLRKLLADNNS